MKIKFDPLKIFPDEICDEILKYLKFQDIKEASLVNKQWYNVIGRSKSCMKKICLKPKKSHQNDEFFKSILNSTRMYQNMEIIDRLNQIKSNTKYLRLTRDVVTKLAPSLISLKLSNDLIIKEDLCRLRELEFDAYNFTSLIAANGLLTKAKQIEKLVVNCVYIDKKSMKYLRHYLMENESLKVLKIEDNRLFHGLGLSSNIKFRLDEFFTDFRDPIPFDFFKLHSESLKITKSMLSTNETSFFMSNFPQLHTLRLKANWHRDDSFDIPFNDTVRKVKIDVSSYAIRNGYLDLQITRLIEKVQNLQELEIDYINSPILHALFNSRSLKTVKFGRYNLTREDYDEIEAHGHINFVLLESQWFG